MNRYIRLTIVGAIFGCLMVGSTPVAAQQLLYLSTAGTLQVIDAATNQIVSTSAASINDITVGPDGARLYTYTDSGGTAALQVLDAETRQITATIPLNGPPGYRLRLAPDGNTAYLPVGSGLYVIDTVAESATLVPLAVAAVDVALSPDGKWAHLPSALTLQTGQVTVMDTETNTVATTISVPFPPHFSDSFAVLALSPDGRFLYLPERSSGSIVVIDTSTNAVIGTITDDLRPQDITVSPDGQFAYVSHSQGTISVVDLSAQSVEAEITLPQAPARLALAADGSRLYAVNPSACSVTVVDTASRSVLTAIPVNEGPTAIALGVPPPPETPTATPAVTPTPSPAPSAARVCAYVTSLLDEVSVIDTQTQLLVGSFAVPHPGHIALKSDGTRAYVTSNTDLAVIDTSINAVTDRIILGSMPSSIVLSGDGGTAYVGLFKSPCYTMFTVDTAAGTIGQRIGCNECSLFSSPPQVLDLAVTPDGQRAYVIRLFDYGDDGGSVYGETLSVIDLTSGSTISTLVFDEAASPLAITPDGRTMYVGLRYRGSIPQRTAVGVIDTATNALINRVDLATGAVNAQVGALAISPDGSAAYVAHSGINGGGPTGSISVIGTRTNRQHPNQLIGSVPLDEPAWALAFTPDGASAYASGGGLVSIIDTSSLSVVYRVFLPNNEGLYTAIGTIPYGCVAPLNPVPTATRTSTPTATTTRTQTKTPSVTRTSTPPRPTATDTPTATATATSTFTASPTPSLTPTNTPHPPTATGTPTVTGTVTPTATSPPTPTYTSSATPVPTLTPARPPSTSSDGGCSVVASHHNASRNGWLLLPIAAMLLWRKRTLLT
jgi:YVTN family beta-propeller protein